MTSSKDDDNDERSVRTLVLDGGVSDNTGIDTIYEFIRGLNNIESPRGQRILKLLRKRHILFLEIDSGGKPSPPTKFDQLLGVALEPIIALGNAGYTNAEMTKEHYMHRLVKLLSYDAELTRTSDETSDMKSENVVRLTVQCSRFSLKNPDRNAVMTAWTLGPNDKANVIARFAFEIERLEFTLQNLADSRANFQKTKELTERAFPEFAQKQLRNEIEGTVEYANRLGGIIEQGVFDVMNKGQLKEFEHIVLPYQQAVQQIKDFTKGVASSPKDTVLPDFPTKKLENWYKSRQAAISEKLSSDGSADSPAQVQQLPNSWRQAIEKPSHDYDRQSVLKELRAVSQKVEKTRKSVEKRTQQSKKWFQKKRSR